MEWLQKNLTTPSELCLKVGARVMVTANLPSADKQSLIAANGDMGTVYGWDPTAICVTLDNGREIDVEHHTWDFDPTSERNTGTFRQFPLRLAWACTIHKSQGLTLDAALQRRRIFSMYYLSPPRIPSAQHPPPRSVVACVSVCRRTLAAWQRSVARSSR